MLYRNPWKGISWLLLLLLPFNGIGQEYLLQHQFLSTEDGLSSRFTRKVIQDEQGFIWVATSEGLNRYDGEKVLYYNKAQHGLAASDINLLYEGPDGLLWVGEWIPKNHKGVMGGGLKLSFFDPKSGKAFSFQEYFGDEAPFEEEELYGLYVDSSRKAWMGTSSGKAYCFDGVRFQLLLDNKAAHPISYALPADGRSFWLLGPNSLLRMDSAGNVLEQDTITGQGALPRGIFLLNNGGVLLQSFWYKLIKYPGQELSQQYRLPNGEQLDVSFCWTIKEDSRGWLWCFRKGGLAVYDQTGRQIVFLPENSSIIEEHAIDAPFTSIFIDADELAWISTQEGLLLLDVRENVFRRYLTGRGYSLRGIAQLGPDSVLLNTYKGLYTLGLSSGGEAPLFEEQALYGLGMTTAPDGSIWAASHGNKAIRINPEGDSFEAFPIKDQDGILFDPLYPFIDKNGKLWMGTVSGIAAFDTASRKFVFDERLNRKLGDRACTWICEGKEGLWVATDEGLFLITPGGAQVLSIDELPHYYICHIYRESSRRLWLSTRGGGLILWDRERGSTQQFTIENGFSSNILYAAYPDARGFLWLPSQNGLMSFDTSAHTVQVFKKLHGLPSNEFNSYAHLRLDDGRLLLGTVDGLVSLSPQDVPVRHKENTKLGILQVQQFDANTGMMEDITAAFVRQGFLELASRRRFAIFRFFLDDYFLPKENRYFYKIEGLDPSWQIMLENQVSLGQLPWGEYTLKVRAMGQDGYWASNELAIPLHSIRPVYLRWWFILGLALAVFALVALYFRLRLLQLKRSKRLLEAEVARRTQQIERDRRTIAKQKAHLEELNAAKDKLFSIVGHELRGPLMYFGNIANRISYALEEKEYSQLADLGKKARNLAYSTSNMLNNLLNWSLLESGRLSFGEGPADVERVFGQVMDTYRELAGLKQLKLSLEVTSGLRVQAGKDGLAILLQNLLSNAIKYTPEGGAVSIRAFSQEGQAVIAIADSGKGMPASLVEQLLSATFISTSHGTIGERGAGLGLQIVQEILRRYDGELKVESREGEGSTFTLLLPLAGGEG